VGGGRQFAWVGTGKEWIDSKSPFIVAAAGEPWRLVSIKEISELDLRSWKTAVTKRVQKTSIRHRTRCVADDTLSSRSALREIPDGHRHGIGEKIGPVTGGHG